jgi:hypothetical protein
MEANPDKAMGKEPPSGDSAADDEILESSQKPPSEELTPKECFHLSPQLHLFCLKLFHTVFWEDAIHVAGKMT